MTDNLPEVYTTYKRPPSKLEPGGGPSKVETAGYIPPKVQISNFFIAGKRLAAARKEMYDIPEGSEEDDAEIDPTRHYSFDLADASQRAQEIAERRRENARKSKAEEEAKKKQEEEKKEPPVEEGK